MMKKFAFVLFAGLVLLWATGCEEEVKEQEQTEQETTEETAAATTVEVEQLFKDAAGKVDQEISVTGYVTHTCKHSGRRCFIVGEDPKKTLRVEAVEIPEGFKADLIGSKITVTGFLREKKLSKDEIGKKEEHLHSKLKEEDGAVESCHAEIMKVEEMKKWMEENDKMYFPIYFVDGTAYEVTEKKEAE